MKDQQKIIYKGYMIEPTDLTVYYNGEQQGETLIKYYIKRKEGNLLYFYRSSRIVGFNSIKQAQRAIRDKRIFPYGTIPV